MASIDNTGGQEFRRQNRRHFTSRSFFLLARFYSTSSRSYLEEETQRKFLIYHKENLCSFLQSTLDKLLCSSGFGMSQLICLISSASQESICLSRNGVSEKKHFKQKFVHSLTVAFSFYTVLHQRCSKR